ncbi:MAG TPA: sensor domain-containing diguanylate cyclase, partial [Allocoleopsis sp.]
VTFRGTTPDAEPRTMAGSSAVQFLLQLNRSAGKGADLVTIIDSPPYLSTGIAHQTALQTVTTIYGWTHEEIESIEVIGSQIGLAYSALYWRQRLEQSRQQAALVGRISRLLNSTLNPDEILGRIVAELGYGLQCDRSILVDLRLHPVNILAVWDHPDRKLDPLQQHQIDRDYWQNVIEMFMQGGASYLQVSLNDLDSDPLQDWLSEIGVMSVLLVPLFIQEEFFGAVALLSYLEERIYLLDELQTVRQVADQAAIALTNAQHYQSLWRKKETLLQQNNTLQQEVLRDELTQLMNRRSLEREMEQLSTKTVWRIQPAFSIIVCDIDYFKLINDIHGHLIGDEVLCSLAQRLQGQLRRGTAAYRYGGEEFVVILTDTALPLAMEVAERLRQAVRSQTIITKTAELSVTASFGVAQRELSHDQSAWDVLQRADRALYEAKRRGRDQVYSFFPS